MARRLRRQQTLRYDRNHAVRIHYLVSNTQLDEYNDPITEVRKIDVICWHPASPALPSLTELLGKSRLDVVREIDNKVSLLPAIKNLRQLSKQLGQPA